VLGYCIVVVGLFTSGGFFPLDFGFSVSEKNIRGEANTLAIRRVLPAG
jgi:hypothetical protein